MATKKSTQARTRKPVSTPAKKAAAQGNTTQPAKARATRKTATTGSTPPAATPEAIAKRAYEIWIANGRPTDQDDHNWQQAERELTSNR
jgi:hypothetical protein